MRFFSCDRFGAMLVHSLCAGGWIGCQVHLVFKDINNLGLSATALFDVIWLGLLTSQALIPKKQGPGEHKDKAESAQLWNIPLVWVWLWTPGSAFPRTEISAWRGQELLYWSPLFYQMSSPCCCFRARVVRGQNKHCSACFPYLLMAFKEVDELLGLCHVNRACM